MNKIAVRSMVFAAIVAPTALLAQEAQPAQEAAPAGAVQAAADDLVADKGDDEFGEVASATVQVQVPSPSKSAAANPGFAVSTLLEVAVKMVMLRAPRVA